MRKFNSMSMWENNPANKSMITAGAGASVSNLGTMTADYAAGVCSRKMVNLQA